MTRLCLKVLEILKNSDSGVNCHDIVTVILHNYLTGC